MAAGVAVALNEDTVEPEAEQQWQQKESWEFLAVYRDRQIKSMEMVEVGSFLQVHSCGSINP